MPDTDEVVMSVRQRQVADGVREGLDNKQIARRLGVSTTTVKNHLTMAYAITGCQNRTQLALWVERRAASHG